MYTRVQPVTVRYGALPYLFYSIISTAYVVQTDTLRSQYILCTKPLSLVYNTCQYGEEYSESYFHCQV